MADFNHTKSKKQAIKNNSLAVYSKKDKVWDTHRSDALDIEYIYINNFDKLSERIKNCSKRLAFNYIADENGEMKLKLDSTQFCRVRYCPVCQWRRSMMWQARFLQALPTIEEKYKNSAWLFLTLTVKNCEITELRETIQTMNNAFKKLTKRKEFKSIKGFIKTTEVTKSKDNTAHPHFHVLLHVSKSYFKNNYISHEKWIKLWQSCLQINYEPNVDVRKVRAKKNKTELETVSQELLKYSTKNADKIDNQKWFIELTKQTHKLRFISTGGTLKNVLKLEKETDDDLIHIEQDKKDEIDDDSPQLIFDFYRPKRKYFKTK